MSFHKSAFNGHFKGHGIRGKQKKELTFWLEVVFVLLETNVQNVNTVLMFRTKPLSGSTERTHFYLHFIYLFLLQTILPK